MSWSIGYDSRWKRDIGYGVPAYCDYPGCDQEIDRGLSYVCADSEPYGGDGCGLYFCGEHLQGDAKQMRECCERCEKGEAPFEAKPDHPEWILHKLTHESWRQWRDENPGEVERLSKQATDSKSTK